MKLALFLAVMTSLSLSAVAAPPEHSDDNRAVIGDVVSGIQAEITMDGDIRFNVPHKRLWLGDGREMRFADGKWKVYPADPTGPPSKITATDFSLYADRYIGHAVEVSGGVIYRANTDLAMFAVPGRNMVVWFVGTPREQLRPLIEHCTFLVPSPSCSFTITGPVLKRADNGVIGIRAEMVSAAPSSGISHGILMLSK